MKYLIKNKAWDLVEDYNIDKLLYLLIDRPDQINSINNFIYQNNKNQYYRGYDLPSYAWYDGNVYWVKNDYFHRERSKPAIISHDGSKEYWLNGKRIQIECSQ